MTEAHTIRDVGPSFDRTKVPSSYTDLSASTLAKLINDEYEGILKSERVNFPKAQSIGEKLVALRRGAEHGEWEKKLKAHCPVISYETATLYARLWNKREDIVKAAVAKGVATTSLTIDAAARKLITTPKKQKENGSKSVEPSAEIKADVLQAGVEPPLAPKSDEDIGKEWLKGLAADELVSWLRDLHGTDAADYLAALSKALAPPMPEKPTKRV
jgi:hypothetical protein